VNGPRFLLGAVLAMLSSEKKSSNNLILPSLAWGMIFTYLFEL